MIRNVPYAPPSNSKTDWIINDKSWPIRNEIMIVAIFSSMPTADKIIAGKNDMNISKHE